MNVNATFLPLRIINFISSWFLIVSSSPLKRVMNAIKPDKNLILCQVVRLEILNQQNKLNYNKTDKKNKFLIDI